MINQDTLKSKIYLHKINNPILSSNLQFELHCTGSAIRTGVRLLRDNEMPIGSTDGKRSLGYFLADNAAELQPTIENFQSRIRSLSVTVKAMARAFNIDLQEDLFY